MTTFPLPPPQLRTARHDAIAAYAARMAGSSFDLAPDLESAGIAHLLRTIGTKEENKRLVAELEQLDRRTEELPPEEREGANYAPEGSTPSSRLRGLMEEHGLRQRDLLHVFSSRGIASEVVRGKRAISKAQAKKLAELFHVPADLFFVI